MDLRWMEDLIQYQIAFASGKMGPDVWGLPVGGVRGWSPGYDKSSAWKFSFHPLHEDRIVHFAKNYQTVDPAIFKADDLSEIEVYKDYINKRGANVPPHPRRKNI